MTKGIAAAALALTLMLMLMLSPGIAFAEEDYPSKAIRVIVPYPAGGGVDVVARIFQARFGEILGQQVIVENRPGASGAVGAQIVSKADPDGYTVLFCASDFITLPQLMPQMKFSPMKELLPVAMVTNSPLVLAANANTPFNDVKGFLDAARANPNGLSYATPGQGTLNNVIGQWIAVSAHIKMVQIAYHGGGPAAEGVAAGDVPVGIVQPVAVYPSLVDAGKVKIIALTGAKRPDFMPASWQTLTESGLPIDANLWLGMFAPVGTPDAIVARLDRAITEIVQDGEIRKRMNETGINPEHVGPGPFADKIRSEAAHYEVIIREAGMHFE